MSPKRIDRILWNTRPEDFPTYGGNIDEVVLHDVTVHVEQMDDHCWWIGIYKDNPDRYWMGNFVVNAAGEMRFYEQENAGIEWGDDSSHDQPADGVHSDLEDEPDAYERGWIEGQAHLAKELRRLLDNHDLTSPAPTEEPT